MSIRKQVVAAFPGKEILIGETGWPSHGRMRDGALASRVNQARFISEILERARQDNFRVNFFEAYDEPWKRRWEGTVGGYWGLFDGAERKLKYPAGVAISNYPFWKLQMACGLFLCIGVFAVALVTLKRRPSPPPLASWLAVADVRDRRRDPAGRERRQDAPRKLRARRLAGSGLSAGGGSDSAAAVHLCLDVGARRFRRFLKCWGHQRA